MSIEHADRAPEAETSHEANVTSKGNSVVLSAALFVALFALFAGGVYVMSLISPDQPSVGLFLGGVSMCLVSLFCTFDLVPRFLSR